MTADMASVIMAALDGGLREDEQAVNDSLNWVAESSGWHGLFGACCGFAEAALRASNVPREDGVVIGLQVLNARTGEQVSIDRTDMDLGLQAASRIVAAVGSKDFDAALSVFDAEVSVSAERGHDVVSATLALAVTAISGHPKFREVYGGGS